MFRAFERFLAVVVALVAVAQLRAEDDALAVINTAVAAHGGAGKIAKTKIGEIKGTIKGNIPPSPEFDVTFEEVFDLPRRHKRLVKGTVGGMAFRLEYAFQDGKGWLKRGDQAAQPVDGKAVPIEKRWNAMLELLVLMRGNDYVRTRVGETKVGDRPAFVCKVSSKDGIAELAFDKETGLLVRSKKRMPGFLGGAESDAEVLYGKFKDVAGVKFPMQISTYSDGKRTTEVNITDIKFLPKIDENVFAKP